MFALGMALFMMSMIALVVDSITLYSWSARANSSAQIAAVAGANAVNPDYLYVGNTSHILDAQGAADACAKSGDTTAQISTSTSGEGTVCVSDGCTVWAGVKKNVDLPVGFFGTHVLVRGDFSAQPVIGATQANRPLTMGCSPSGMFVSAGAPYSAPAQVGAPPGW